MKNIITIILIFLLSGSFLSNAWGKDCPELIEAAKNGDAEKVKELIDDGCDMSIQVGSGRPAIITAAQKGHLEIVKLLINHGININSRGRFDETALSIAALVGHVDVVKYLIEKGTDVNLKDKNGRTAFTNAARNGHIEVVKLLLKKGMDKYNINAAIAKAAGGRRKEHIEIVKLLLENGADVNSTGGKEYGWTSLLVAIESGNVEMVELLLKNGADIKVENRSGTLESPLMMAERRGHKEIVKLLIDNGADNTIAYRQVDRDLVSVSVKGELDKVKELIAKGADVNKKHIHSNGTPLMFAAGGGHIETVKLLIEKGADIHAKDKYGRTALTKASGNGHSEIVRLLFDKGADMNIDDKTGFTELMYAINRKDLAAVKKLIREGADLNAHDKTSSKSTPLAHAIIDLVDLYRNRDLLYYGIRPMNVPEIVKVLLDNGAKVDGNNVTRAYRLNDNELAHLLIDAAIKSGIDNESGDGIIAAASRAGDIEWVKKLNNAKGDLSGDSGSKALENAATDLELLKSLIESGADIKSKGGRAALINAASAGKGEAVEYLIKAGADVNARGGYKNGSPLIWAAEKGYGANMFQLEPERFETDCDVGDHCYHEIKYFVKAVSEGTNRLNKRVYWEIGVNYETVLKEKRWEKRDPRLDDEFLERVKAATKKGHFKVLDALIKNGADLNATNDWGETALMKAAEIGDAQTVKVLIENGANVNITVTNNYSALEYALDNGNLITAKIILEAVAASGETDVKRNYTAPIYSFENGGEYVKKILDDDKSDVNAHDENGITALIHAVIREDKEAMEKLLTRGADVNAKDKYGNTALMYAVRRSNPGNRADDSFVKYLIKKGADVNASNNEGETVFMWAIFGGSFASVDNALYSNGANVKAKTKDGVTAIMFTVELDGLSLHKIVGYGGVNAKDNNGKTALIRAVEKGRNLHAVTSLVTRYSADVNIKDNFDKTALDYAKEKGYDDFARILKEAGAKE